MVKDDFVCMSCCHYKDLIVPYINKIRNFQVEQMTAEEMEQRVHYDHKPKNDLMKSLYKMNYDDEEEEQKVSFGSNFIELAFTIVLEVIAMFDLVGDLLFIFELWDKNQTEWFTLSVFTMLAPYYVCYVPLLTALRNQEGRE